ncbi:MAG: hypothetical protein COU25_04100 [Candidatus Levybacteria bacterium CG10_big_fil_rev_8_21_14_0_10_35_13]|nr:MAG: hypothetical protein COU25_04100 [Candidatus Levybacteria bacterium CG10_big_fil_rev_8_21_14_0_10_35_13]
MGNFNKVLSFILGLVVVIVFVIVLSKRLNLQSKFIPFSNNTTPTPTVVQTAEKESKEVVEKKPEIKFTQPDEQTNQETITQVKTIPETGPSSSLLLLYGSAGTIGFLLRKIKK